MYRDYKTMVQQISQNRFKETPHYTLIREYGPDHDKTFEIKTIDHRKIITAGTGKIKKKRNNSSRKALAALEKLTTPPETDHAVDYSFFIMNRGCPIAVFLQEEKRWGPIQRKLRRNISKYCSVHLQSVKKNPDDIQIAFYGGNFTGLAQKEQISCWDMQCFLSEEDGSIPSEFPQDRMTLTRPPGAPEKIRVQTTKSARSPWWTTSSAELNGAIPR